MNDRKYATSSLHIRTSMVARNTEMRRTQMVVHVSYSSTDTPPKEQKIRERIGALQNGVHPDRIVLFGLNQKDDRTSSGFCLIYDSVNDLEHLEPQHRLKRRQEQMLQHQKQHFGWTSSTSSPSRRLKSSNSHRGETIDRKIKDRKSDPIYTKERKDEKSQHLFRRKQARKVVASRILSAVFCLAATLCAYYAVLVLVGPIRGGRRFTLQHVTPLLRAPLLVHDDQVVLFQDPHVDKTLLMEERRQSLAD